MNYLRYTYENGLNTYLQTDGILNTNLSYKNCIGYIYLNSYFHDRLSRMIVPIRIELANRNDYEILTTEDHDLIFSEFKLKFRPIFEEILSVDSVILDFNIPVKRIQNELGIFARALVKERIKKISKS